MEKQLKQQLQRIVNRPRPRPFMRVGSRNGKPLYVRKCSLTWQQYVKLHPDSVVHPTERQIVKVLAKGKHTRGSQYFSDFLSRLMQRIFG